MEANLDRAASFRRRAMPRIVVILVLLVAGDVAYRVLAQEKDPYTDQIMDLMGETYNNVYMYFGPPILEEEDNQGGRVLHYEDFRVRNSHFKKGTYRIYVGADGRVYKFQRD